MRVCGKRGLFTNAAVEFTSRKRAETVLPLSDSEFADKCAASVHWRGPLWTGP